MPVSFAAGPPKRAARPRAKAQVEDVGGGWTLRESRAPALGKAAARAFARAVRSAAVKQGGQEGPWAVRGEVPLEEESSACGCTTAVMRGVKMHLPEKLMGGNWLELHHAASGFHLGWDPLSALQCWAREALEALDTKRGGGTVWTGWAFDAEQLEQAWRDSAWADSTSYTRREEWDWSFRTTYEGTVVRDAAAVGECERKVAQRCQHGLIRAAFTKPAAATGAAAAETTAAAAAAAAAETVVDWRKGTDADFAAPWDVAAAKEGGGATDCAQGGAADGAAGEEEDDDDDDEEEERQVLVEKSLKLYEDWMSELGITQLLVRFRRYQSGWEVRLRWWICLNPRFESKRGVPHARMRTTTYRLLPLTASAVAAADPDAYDPDADPDAYAAWRVVRRVEEQELRFVKERVGEWEGSAALDADFMAALMPLSAAVRIDVADLHAAQPRPTAPAAAAALPAAAPDVQPAACGQKRPASCSLQPTVCSLQRAARLPTRVTCLVAHPHAPLVAAGACASGALRLCRAAAPGALFANMFGRLSEAAWADAAHHAGVEGLAFASGPDGRTLVLSSGADGHVRAWGCDGDGDEGEGGFAAGECVVGGVGADLAAGRLAVVQCIAATSFAPDAAGSASALAAGCGRSVVPLRFVTEAAAPHRLVACAPHPPLPSAVSELRFSADGGALVAGTLHSGAFLWWTGGGGGGDADAPRAPALRLPCHSSVASVQLLPDAAWCAARCTDSTLRLWRCVPRAGGGTQPPHPAAATAAAAEAAEAAAALPMTFGGMQPLSLGGGTPLVLARAGGTCGADTPPSLLAVADSDGGVIVWDLAACGVGGDADAAAPATPAVPPCCAPGSLAVDTRRACRVLLPRGRRATCLARSPATTGAAGGGAGTWQIACGCDDGGVLLLAQRAAQGPWEVVAEARPPPHGAGEEDCAVVGLAWLQASTTTTALYAASASGGVFCWSPEEATA